LITSAQWLPWGAVQAVIALIFPAHGLFSAWAYRRTGHPWAAGIANAVVFAWAIGMTFPLLAG
jgi:hypothetical protein